MINLKFPGWPYEPAGKTLCAYAIVLYGNVALPGCKLPKTIDGLLEDTSCFETRFARVEATKEDTPQRVGAVKETFILFF